MTVHLGDCLVGMQALDAESIDAIVTDPPYGLAFMGKAWDHGVPGAPFWTEALRVAKPGAHLVAFGGTRTFHRLTCAIEDAGWEIRDCLSWLYGSGFPKSLDVSKAMDKAAGAEREVVGTAITGAAYTRSDRRNANDGFERGQVVRKVTDPATDLARQWQGWGTALKPAWEPILLARKPLIGTVAANVTQHGTGGLNVDGCRIGAEALAYSSRISKGCDARRFKQGTRPIDYSEDVAEPKTNAVGRWPANVCLDEDAAAMLDAQSGERKTGMAVRSHSGGKTFGGNNAKPPMGDMGYGDTGGASRFFYTAKASRREREAGLEGVPERTKRILGGGITSADHPETAPGGGDRTARNHHPTVKPLALMRWLCRLVTPPGGTILDPFTGSGTTGCAAVLDGFRFTGFEQDAAYAAIAEQRIAHHARLAQPDLLEAI